jgi:hypothetical protein
MITREEYEQALKTKDEADKVINQYFREKQQAFDERMKNNPVFTEEELRFSASTCCPCGAGLAYPKGCGMHHYWDCSAILMGKASLEVKHTDKLPFSFYDVKSESSYRGTTRPSGKPDES